MSSGGGLSPAIDSQERRFREEMKRQDLAHPLPTPTHAHFRPIPICSVCLLVWPLRPQLAPPTHPTPRPLPFALLPCLAQPGCKEFSLVHVDPSWPAGWETAAQAQLLFLAITGCRTSCCTRSGPSSSRRSGLKSLRLTLGRVGPKVDSGRIWEIHPWGAAQGGL